MQMLKNWNPEQIPEKEDIKVRLSAARTRLYELQMALKEHKIPVIVLFEGWGASGKSQLCQRLQKRTFGNHFFTGILRRSRKPVNLHSWIPDGWIRPAGSAWTKN